MWHALGQGVEAACDHGFIDVDLEIAGQTISKRVLVQVNMGASLKVYYMIYEEKVTAEEMRFCLDVHTQIKAIVGYRFMFKFFSLSLELSSSAGAISHTVLSVLVGCSEGMYCLACGGYYIHLQ